MKYGFAINAEQEFTDDLRGFVRAGWNEGQHESWNYTEVDQTVAFGADLRGALWSRARDKFGVAFVGNGISHNHREYLALGGLSFLLGDGKLTYGPEKIIESYYNFPIPIMRGFFGAFDIQYIDNPGYNRARGPVVVLRLDYTSSFEILKCARSRCSDMLPNHPPVRQFRDLLAHNVNEDCRIRQPEKFRSPGSNL